MAPRAKDNNPLALKIFRRREGWQKPPKKLPNLKLAASLIREYVNADWHQIEF